LTSAWRAPMAAAAPHLFANERIEAARADRLPAPPGTETFVRVARAPAQSAASYMIASDIETSSVDVYDETSGSLLYQCAGCGGWGLAVNRGTGDVAIGTNKGTVTVWHVSASALTLYAKMTLSQGVNGARATGVAYDSGGNLYAVDWPSNAIDVFPKNEIKLGKGLPKRTIVAPAFADVYYLATDGDTLLADGYDPAMNDIVATVDTKTGNDALLQTISNSHGGFPGGLAIDAHDTLIVNNQYGTITTYASPWTGAATSTLSYGFPSFDYIPISLDRAQTTLWAGNLFYEKGQLYTDVQANSYPLSTLGTSTAPMFQEEYLGLALDPQKKF
jgi:hypothetical protein